MPESQNYRGKNDEKDNFRRTGDVDEMSGGTAQTFCGDCGKWYNTDCGHKCPSPGERKGFSMTEQDTLFSLPKREKANTVSNDVKTLFLDDSKERHKIAREYFGGYWVDVTWCWTAEEAIRALQSRRYNVVFLDHDLGGEQMVDSKRPDTGMEVVRWIVKHKPPIDSIVIHSWNMSASKEMCARLIEAGYNASRSPFSGNIFLVE